MRLRGNRRSVGKRIGGHHAGQVRDHKRPTRRFRLKATNGQTVAVSEGYKTKASVNKGVESVKKLAADAAVVDLTE